MTDNLRKNKVDCFAIIGNLTSAMRAQGLLNQAAIPSNIVKKSGVGGKKGCSYALEFSCNQLGNVKYTLENSNIKIKEWEG